MQRCGSCKQDKALEEFSPSYRGRVGTWCRPCFAAYNRGERGHLAAHEPHLCEWCGSPYVPQTKQSRGVRYCSRGCKDLARTARYVVDLAASKPARVCLQCGMALPQSMRADAKFCSATCNSNAHQLKRKLRSRGGPSGSDGYVRVQIAERDKWRCGICGGAVSKDRRYPDPLCGSLDHVIPVSQGGTSDPYNLRLTHLRCNVQRRDGGGGEQLALI